MTTSIKPLEVTEPGRYDMSANAYHRDPVPGGSLSSSGARKLLPPSCPARFKYDADHGQAHRTEFDLGHAAHTLVLGVGEPIVVIDADAYRTKDAKAERDAAYEAGHTPLLTAEYEQVQAMAAALRAHPIANALFNPELGRAEQCLFWRDEHTGIWRRAMLDWLPNLRDGHRLIVGDYKTTKSAEPGSISRSMSQYGYGQQAAWYIDGVKALGLAGKLEPAFLLVFQEKVAPYLVTVVQPNPEALLWGQRLNRKAIDTYRQCKTTGIWPGYADDVISVGLPAWAIKQHEEAWIAGDYETQENTAA